MKTCKIAAPACSVGEAEKILDAGADIVYFGIMTSEWTEKYGNADFISRRQTEAAHISSQKDFPEIAALAQKRNSEAMLVLNGRYSNAQLPYLYALINNWEEAGGHSIMISDISLLLYINGKKSRLKPHMSIMCGTFNKQTISFFSRLGASGIVLPRELSLNEIRQLISRNAENMEFEIITMFQKCEFIDAFCNFYHAVNYQHCKSKYVIEDKIETIESFDPQYEGHGCQLPFSSQKGNIRHICHNDSDMPACGACMISSLITSGITRFKIAGRGYPVEQIVKAVKWIKYAIDNCHSTEMIKTNYQNVFGKKCNPSQCYYT